MTKAKKHWIEAPSWAADEQMAEGIQFAKTGANEMAIYLTDSHEEPEGAAVVFISRENAGLLAAVLLAFAYTGQVAS